MEEFTDTYRRILETLRDLDEAELSLRSKGVIIKQTEVIAKRITDKRNRVRRKAGDLMGRKVVENEGIR